MIDESSQSDNFLERKEKESAQREKEGNQRKRDKKQQAKKKGKITQKYSNQELIEIRKEHFRFKIILHTNKKIGSSNLALKDRIYTKTVIRELEEEKQAQTQNKVTSPNREEQQQYFKQRADTLISQFCVKKQPTVLNQEQQKQTVQTKLNLTGKPINEEKKGKSKKKEVKKKQEEEDEDSKLIDTSNINDQDLKTSLQEYGINVKSSMGRKKQERIFREVFKYKKLGMLPNYL